MEDNKDKNIEAIAKLILLTRDDKLKWTSANTSAIPMRGDDAIDSVFITIYKDKILRLYRRKYKWTSISTHVVGIFTGSKSTEPQWFTEIVLEIIDELGRSLWAFPKEEILKDLLKTIQYKVSGADDLISSLINE